MTSRRGAPRTLKALLALALPIGALAGGGGILALSGTAGAATTPAVLHVAPGGATSGACTATHPCGSLGFALSQAVAGGTVDLAAGTYKEAANPSGTSNVVTKAVTVEGVATHPTTVVVTATGEEFGLVVGAGTTVVKDVTFEDAGSSGVLVSPNATAPKPATVAKVTLLTDHIVTNDKCGTTSTFHKANATTICKTPTPESGYGEGIHLLSVSHSTIKGNDVSNNFGGILVTDELGPNFTNTIETNQVSTNAGDCGITIASHNSTAVHTSGTTTGKPDPTAGGVYGNTIKGNTADNNGAAGLLAATPFPGTAVYTNTFETNTAEGNGLPGMTIHSHAPLQDTKGNKVLDNTFENDALHGSLTHGSGTSTARNMQTTGIEVLATAGPTDVAGTVITGNTISTVFYGIWLSPGVASVSTIGTNTITVTGGGTAVYSEPASVTTVSGTSADATAAAEFARAFPATRGSCPTTRDAVIATTKEYQDALSSQFLAEDLTTGTLLTPTTTLSAVTAATLKQEGIATVYLVGGPLALTTAVATAIGDVTAYACGGTSPSGKIAVHRITGNTQYGTAEAVAEFVGAAASKSFPGAYATTNATAGTGKYNDTAAKGSSAPTGSVPTAILASGEEFQDAQAASVVSYHTKLPLLLTPATALSTTALAAIQKLGVKQVILMGGPLAVTNTVEAALATKAGVSVLRVAGSDYTDTAAELAKFEAAGSTNGLGWTIGHRVMVARGNGFTDGLAGAVLENTHNVATGAPTTARPLLLTETPTTVGTSLNTFLTVTGHTGIGKTAAKTVAALTVLGGPLAVSTVAVSVMETDLSH
ncbi:MAG: cell wall-binding repeat-containing protein [Acidimicrobiales bacterium]